MESKNEQFPHSLPLNRTAGSLSLAEAGQRERYAAPGSTRSALKAQGKRDDRDCF